MVQTKVFKSNQTQAVRLPKAVAFPEGVKEVSIAIVGDTRIIAPVEQSWDTWFASETATDDWLEHRQQDEQPSRESLDSD